MPSLSLAEWIVLTLVDEAPTHGFAVAALTGDGGTVGRVWHVPRPVVYRSLDRLGAFELVRVEATEAGSRGPQRSILTTTPAGAGAVSDWLGRPVEHVRDLRSEFLVKLALLDRRGRGTADLVARQREVVAPLGRALERRQATASGFDRVLAAWRSENVLAALRFLDAVDTHS
ncbi:hypothetical protein ACFFX1_13345 [Dactylosporangium sucinum]|uniref:PadR family transcriptional regulator n=1 Tax=Dactylosporangium sucinum TaxID=1424081 RepID=A0A917X6D1_9ACTN|nr:PadR family transcriptional regulator [Dactylosporangium sucinum]GGM73794.1 hypothetical protein GCM10007977_089170 [Dactylosporangium sucinum]